MHTNLPANFNVFYCTFFMVPHISQSQCSYFSVIFAFVSMLLWVISLVFAGEGSLPHLCKYFVKLIYTLCFIIIDISTALLHHNPFHLHLEVNCNPPACMHSHILFFSDCINITESFYLCDVHPSMHIFSQNIKILTRSQLV